MNMQCRNRLSGVFQDLNDIYRKIIEGTIRKIDDDTLKQIKDDVSLLFYSLKDESDIYEKEAFKILESFAEDIGADLSDIEIIKKDKATIYQFNSNPSGLRKVSYREKSLHRIIEKTESCLIHDRLLSDTRAERIVIDSPDSPPINFVRLYDEQDLLGLEDILVTQDENGETEYDESWQFNRIDLHRLFNKGYDAVIHDLKQIYKHNWGEESWILDVKESTVAPKLDLEKAQRIFNEEMKKEPRGFEKNNVRKKAEQKALDHIWDQIKYDLDEWQYKRIDFEKLLSSSDFDIIFNKIIQIYRHNFEEENEKQLVSHARSLNQSLKKKMWDFVNLDSFDIMDLLGGSATGITNNLIYQSDNTGIRNLKLDIIHYNNITEFQRWFHNFKNEYDFINIKRKEHGKRSEISVDDKGKISLRGDFPESSFFYHEGDSINVFSPIWEQGLLFVVRGSSNNPYFAKDADYFLNSSITLAEPLDESFINSASKKKLEEICRREKVSFKGTKPDIRKRIIDKLNKQNAKQGAIASVKSYPGRGANANSFMLSPKDLPSRWFSSVSEEKQAIFAEFYGFTHQDRKEIDFKRYDLYPKPNGYKSIQTIIRRNVDDTVIEIELQMMTSLMLFVAERGSARRKEYVDIVRSELSEEAIRKEIMSKTKSNRQVEERMNLFNSLRNKINLFVKEEYNKHINPFFDGFWESYRNKDDIDIVMQRLNDLLDNYRKLKNDVGEDKEIKDKISTIPDMIKKEEGINLIRHPEHFLQIQDYLYMTNFLKHQGNEKVIATEYYKGIADYTANFINKRLKAKKKISKNDITHAIIGIMLIEAITKREYSVSNSKKNKLFSLNKDDKKCILDESFSDITEIVSVYDDKVEFPHLAQIAQRYDSRYMKSLRGHWAKHRQHMRGDGISNQDIEYIGRKINVLLNNPSTSINEDSEIK